MQISQYNSGFNNQDYLGSSNLLKANLALNTDKADKLLNKCKSIDAWITPTNQVLKLVYHGVVIIVYWQCPHLHMKIV